MSWSSSQTTSGGPTWQPRSLDHQQRPIAGRKGSSYEGGVRVPLIARLPGVTPAGGGCHEPVISIDFYPPILELAGARGDLRHVDQVDGRSIVPLLKSPSDKLEREAIFWHYPHYHPGGATPYGAVRAGDWRLVEFYEDKHVELYNLSDGVAEKNNLATAIPEKAAELRGKLHAWRKSVNAQMPTVNPDYDPVVPARPHAEAAARACNAAK